MVKRLAALIIFAGFLLSGCAILGTTATEADTHASKVEYITSEITQVIQETTAGTTQAQPEITQAQITTDTTANEPQHSTAPETEYSITLKRDVLVLMIAYPDDVIDVEMKDNLVYLVMKSGKSILYDDQRKKSLDEKTAAADIQDMLETIYPLHEIDSLMGTDMDPGRIRAYPFISAVYGNSKDAITKKLITVDFGEQRLPFNHEAGAAAALKTAAAQAAALVKNQSQIAAFLYPSSGTFNYRVIAGTNRLSPHAYGIAIDLNSNSGGYWRWANPADGEKQIKAYPKDLVRIFEKNGFIWGGKWNHFDIFHFEYRPEMIIKAKYFPGKADMSMPWYQGANLHDESVKKYVALIDRSIIEANASKVQTMIQ
jgi:hypothetical protein